MSTHPNVILIADLTPHALSRKTMSDILKENGQEDPDDSDIKIGGESFHTKIMEESYDEGFQLSSKEGDLMFFNMVTYGYGESISWKDLESMKVKLEQWCKETCEKHNCTYEIRIGANYW